jgi:hypothetical protein
MFLFAAQYLEFVSWRQYSIIFCLLLFVPWQVKKQFFLTWIPQLDPSQDRRNPWFRNPCSGTAGGVIVPRHITSRARRFAFSCRLIVPVVFAQVTGGFLQPMRTEINSSLT